MSALSRPLRRSLRKTSVLLAFSAAAFATPPLPRQPLAAGWREEKLPLTPGALAIHLAANEDRRNWRRRAHPGNR